MIHLLVRAQISHPQKPICKDALPLSNFSLAQRTLYHTFLLFAEEFIHTKPRKRIITTQYLVEILHFQAEYLDSHSNVTMN